jgi:hypothetical protein
MNVKILSLVLVATLGFSRFVLGAAWEGTDNFAASISTNKWTIYQTSHGSMTVGVANGHASFIVPLSASTEQQAMIWWKGTPSASNDWTLQIDGHNTASYSVNGDTQLQLVAASSKTVGLNNEAFRIAMARNTSGSAFTTATWAGGGTTIRQTSSATNANFSLRLVYKTVAGNIKAWYDQSGNGTGWTLLDTFNVASFPSGMSITDTFTMAVVTDCYYGPISEGQLYADNFRLLSPPTLTMNGYQGSTSLKIDGFSNVVYRIDYSTNLVASNWTTLNSITVLTNPFTYLDSSASNSPRRFYRVALP